METCHVRGQFRDSLEYEEMFLPPKMGHGQGRLNL